MSEYNNDVHCFFTDHHCEAPSLNIRDKYFPIWEIIFTFVKRKLLRVIAKKILREFWEEYSDCEQQLKSWYHEVDKGTWKNFNELKNEYPSASILEDNRICFNIKGNNCRLIVKVNFNYQMMWIRFIGTHAEYDKIDANKI